MTQYDIFLLPAQNVNVLLSKLPQLRCALRIRPASPVLVLVKPPHELIVNQTILAPVLHLLKSAFMQIAPQ